MTHWSKAVEVLVSGVVGVYLVMLLLQLTTHLSAKVIDRIENWNKDAESEATPEPKSEPKVVALKE